MSLALIVLIADALSQGVVVIVCAVDATEQAETVLAAAKATAERADVPLLLAHVLTSLWESDVPVLAPTPSCGAACGWCSTPPPT